MTGSIRRGLGLVAMLGLGAVGQARAQCAGQWLPGVGAPGISGMVYASTMWDPDGAGPQPPVLVVAGSFSLADGTLVNNIAAWNGSTWSALGAGLGSSGAPNSPIVKALAVYNGTLIAGGSFTTSGTAALGSIARWNGSAWVPMNSGSTKDFGAGGVNALIVAPNGDLIAGGGFTTAGTNTTGTVTVNRVARWDGSAWAAINPSGGTKGVNGTVNALALGSNGDLLVGGAFTTAGTATTGSTTVNRIARYAWNGTNYVVSALGSGMSSAVNAVAAAPNGDIVVGGAFDAATGTTPAAEHIARWNGTAWSAMGGGMNDQVFSLAATASGDIIAAGPFWMADGTIDANGNMAGGVMVGGLARWNGTAWSAMWSQATPRTVSHAAVRADGSILVGGTFKSAGGVPANGVAVLNGSSWQALTAGGTLNSGPVTTLSTLADGDVLAGGGFRLFEGIASSRIARMSGLGVWSTIGGGLFDPSVPFPSAVANGNPPTAAVKMPNGDLVVGGIDLSLTDGGAATLLARWNGAGWAAIPGLAYGGSVFTGLPDVGAITSLAVMPNGDLVAGGLFFFPEDPFTFHFLARWDGVMWRDMGIADSAVQAMFVKPNGHLVIAGGFGFAGGLAGTQGVAEWDGVTFFGDGTPEWTPLGQGANNQVNALALAPNGDLIMVGEFTAVGNVAAGDVPANRIARWDGAAWSALGSGLSNSVYAVAVMPGGDVVAGGAFTAAVGTTPAIPRLARWNGTAWTALGGGVGGAGLITNINYPGGSVFALTVTQTGVLLVGGDFATAGGAASAYLGVWADCVGACCQADGSCVIAAGSPTASCATGTLVPGGACAPNTCPHPTSGVCCRGATCNPGVPQASCTGSGTAGAVFVASATACNSGGSTSGPCCYADYNKVGGLNVQDIFDFLSDWFAGNPYASTGGNGTPTTLNVQNIFDFLSAWFAGGC